MKFTGIRLIGLVAIDLPIIGALPTDTYICKGVDGLGPVGVDVSITRTVNAGNVYQGRQPQDRQIVMRIGLNPNLALGQTVSDLRNHFYGLLTPGYGVISRFQLMDGAEQVAYVTGYVSRIEPNPFSKDPEIQVTIDCMEEYLQAPDEITLTGHVSGGFQVPNLGSAPSGFKIKMRLTANAGGWLLWQGEVPNAIQFNRSFNTNDDIYIDTRPGFRDAYMIRAGVTTSLLGVMTASSRWLVLHGGENLFGAWNAAYTLEYFTYRPQDWGI